MRWDRQFGRDLRAEHAFPNLIVFKLADGAKVRVRAGALARIGDLTPDDRDRLAWVASATMDVERERAQLEAQLRSEAGAQIVPFVVAAREEQAERDRIELESRHGAEYEDLTTAGAIVLPREDMVQSSRVLGILRGNPLVEYAYLQPRGTPPRSTPACTDQLPGVTNTAPVAPLTYQGGRPGGSTFPAPLSTSTLVAGHDIDFARTVAGSTGPGLFMVDVEEGFHFNHENLPNVIHVGGINSAVGNRDHGTAVIGIATGCITNFGPMGIAPSATAGFSGIWFPPPWFFSPALAIDAAKFAGADVILLEWQMSDVSTNGCYACPGGAGVCANLVPPEYYPLERSIIRSAGASRIQVVEAAANAQRDLNVIPQLQRRVDWNDPENSQALVVGGVGTLAFIDGQHVSTCGVAATGSNVGDRLDLSAWYSTVAANGYGSSFPGSPLPNPALRFDTSNPGNVDQWYTDSFGGTSAAAAVVAGGVLSLMGMWRFHNGTSARPAPYHVTRFLAATGTPEAAGVPSNVGPMLQLGMAASAFRDRVVGDVTSTSMLNNVVSAAPVVANGQTNVVLVARHWNAGFAYTVLRGGAWYDWRFLPTWSTSFPGGTIPHDLNNLTARQLADTSAPITELLATDSAFRVVYSTASTIDPAASGSTAFSAWQIVPTTLTTAAAYVTGVDFAAGYHDYFVVTTTGQVRWVYRPVGSTTFSGVAASLPSPRTITSKIVAFSVVPERAELFAIDSNQNLVHATLDGNLWTGWTNVPGGANASMLEGALVGSNRIALAVGWFGGTSMFLLDASSGFWRAVAVESGGPSAVAINSVAPLSARVSTIDAATGVRRTRRVSWVSSALTVGTSYQWSAATATGGIVASPWQNSLGLAFGVDVSGRAVYRVLDHYFPVE